MYIYIYTLEFMVSSSIYAIRTESLHMACPIRLDWTLPDLCLDVAWTAAAGRLEDPKIYTEK